MAINSINNYASAAVSTAATDSKAFLRRPALRRMTPLPVLSTKKAPVTKAVLPRRHRTLLSLQR